jgi:WD40 repeat protein
MSGAGLAGDGAGNLFFSTGDGLFDGPGGTHFGDSVLKLSQAGGALNLADYFTPYNQQFFRDNDLDMSAGAVVLLPEQSGNGSLVLTADKDGTIYLLDPDNMGQYNSSGDFQILQELTAPLTGEIHAGLTFWNNNVYVAAETSAVLAYSLSNDRLSLTPTSQTPKQTANPTGGLVSSNGTNDGIYWYATFPTSKLFAYDANNLGVELYDTNMAPGLRDRLSQLVHFAMPIVANGKVYVNGKTQLSVLGLLPKFTPVAGNNQTGVVGTTLPVALQAALQDPYTGKAIATAGIPVTFTASKKGGSFSNPNVTTDSSGIATTSYTLPPTPGTITITASSPGYASAIFTVTATKGGAATLTISSGNRQSAAVNSPLPAPLKVKAKDAKGNGVPGVVITFSDGSAGGVLSQSTVTTDSLGIATTTYTTGTKAGAVHITASATGVPSVSFTETVLPGPAVSLAVYSGNNQTVQAGQAAPKLLQVLAADQYGNGVSGVSVSYADGGVGGSFAPNPAVTSAKGVAGTRYTVPMQTGTVTVTASSPGLPSALFTVNVN